MSREFQDGRPPFSHADLAASKFDVPVHRAETPAGLLDLEREQQRFEIHSLKRQGIAGPVQMTAALPSMPNYSAGMSSRPARLQDSPPPRVVWGKQELQPFGIFPPEGRSAYTDTSFPWRCVCKISSGTRTGCGVLIGPRHILTASHVIDWGARVAGVSFIRGASVFAAAAAVSAFTYERIDNVDYSNADDDYTVLVLNQRLGDSLGFFGARTYDSGWDNEFDVWCNIAYAPDFAGGDLPVFQTHFFLDEDDFDLGSGRMLITKTGDFVKGMSGSPVFGFWDNGPFVVGVVSAGGEGPFAGNMNAVAGGSNLTRLVARARDEAP